MLKGYNFVLAVLMLVFLVPQQVTAESQFWGDDILIYQASGTVKDFAMDQADKNAIYVSICVEGTDRDTLVTRYSIDNGETWSYPGRHYAGKQDKAGILAARGSSDYVFAFTISRGKVRFIRYTMTLGLGFIGGNWYGEISSISAPADTVVDFSVCRSFDDIYYLFIVYQTQDGRIIFKRSSDYGVTWVDSVAISDNVTINNKPEIAYGTGNLVIAGENTSDSTIHVVRNTSEGASGSWDWGNSIALDKSGAKHRNPSIAASHDTSGSEPVFWVFADWHRTSPPPNFTIHYYYSTDGGATWPSQTGFEDTSGFANRLYPSIHVLPELGSSDITLVYRYEGAPAELRQMLKENQQSTPSAWTPIPTGGVNGYEPGAFPPHKGFTLRNTDSTVNSAVIYEYNQGVYLDASWITDVEDEIGDVVTKKFTLGQNYPNPFNPATAIEYSLDNAGDVEIAVYNILGQKVKTLLKGYVPAGEYRIVWNGTDEEGISVASGVYLYKIKSKDQTETKKMVLMR